MSLLLCRLSKLCFGKPVSVRPSLLILSNGFSSSSMLKKAPCKIVDAYSCGYDLGKHEVWYAHLGDTIRLEKKVPMELMKELGTIGSSNGWVATLKDGIVCLQDDLNPSASYTDPKRIPLPPLVTLPQCQTQIVTNIAMSSSSPEDEDCVVAVKFLGPQLSFCRPAQGNSEWINIRIPQPCFFSSGVMFSEKDDMFCLLGSGGDLIGSWDHRKQNKRPKFQRLRFQNLPELTKTNLELMQSCYTTKHLVESRSTGETFVVKLYKKATASGSVKMQTKTLMVFKLDEQGNAVYTPGIGDLCIFLSKSEPFCVPASSFPGMRSSCIKILDMDEETSALLLDLPGDCICNYTGSNGAPYFIPPQNVLPHYNDPSVKNGKIIRLEDSVKKLEKTLEESLVEKEGLEKKLKDLKEQMERRIRKSRLSLSRVCLLLILPHLLLFTLSSCASPCRKTDTSLETALI